ncbi:MerR family transcriptional regulator [Methylobacterium sp. CCH7-A2]|jgi:DNA-binding transcriptional MerR regulator|uniref:MerR family transcriptional regulator n=1 Tax=Methylobacterium sp. CCH7-A2 TaxID=1768789 RepID=UPI0009EC319A|nr:MerR family transcriptional regulator [Methylobacterium sp. CCH7-A2]
MTHYSIRQISEEFGLTLRAIRFYEQRGLLKLSRDAENGTSPRVFNEDNRARLSDIVKLIKMGFTLKEIASGNISDDQYRNQLALCLDEIAELEEAILLIKEYLSTSGDG